MNSRVARGLGARERPVGAARGEHALERLGQPRRVAANSLGNSCCNGIAHVNIARVRSPRRGSKPVASSSSIHASSPSPRGRGGIEPALQTRPVALELVVVDREQQVGLRREVAVERTRREAGHAEHVGDRHVGGAVAVQELATGWRRAGAPRRAPAPWRHEPRARLLGLRQPAIPMSIRISLVKRQFSLPNKSCYAAAMPDAAPVATYRNSTFISTDSHVTEPIDLYAERVGPSTAIACRASRSSATGAASSSKACDPRKLMPASEREFAIVGDWDADDRRRDQSRDGVAAEVIFPTFALQACFASDDAATPARAVPRVQRLGGRGVRRSRPRRSPVGHGADARHRRRDRRGAPARRPGLPRAVPARPRPAAHVQRPRVRPRSGPSPRISGSRSRSIPAPATSHASCAARAARWSTTSSVRSSTARW